VTQAVSGAGSTGTKGAATRARLLRAAADVVGEAGYGTASVAEIASRAGLSAGALYRHFPSKAALIVELFRSAGEHRLETMRAAAAAHEKAVDRLDAVVTAYATAALANPRLTWALVYEPVDPLVDAERLEYRRRYRDGMAALVQRAIDAGEIPPQDAELAAAGVVGALSEALVGPVSPLGPHPRDEPDLIAAIVRFCRRAVAAS
jgi:AcrR family transcriptional regulator